MGNIFDKICPCFKKKKDHNSLYCPLSQELNDYEYKSKNNSFDFSNLQKLDELKIKPSNFITEKSGIPSESYIKISDIGQGAYGTVVKVRSRLINEDRAMKIIRKDSIITFLNEDRLFNEINILKKVDHPNIIKIYEFFKDSVNYYMVSELCEEGDLFYKLSKKAFFSEKLVCFIMKQIFSAVAYLHSKDILHGDLKLENILIDSSPYNSSNLEEDFFDIKLIDFGCSRFFSMRNQSGVIGTNIYFSPEILDNNFDESSDIWACGVIMYMLLSGVPPFYGSTDEEIFSRIKKCQYDFSPEQFKSVSQNAKDLINDLLNINSKNRPPARKILTHIWFKQKDDIFIVDLNYSRSVLNNLREFNAKNKFQQAVLTFITHNLIQKQEISKLRSIFKSLDKDNDGRISQIELKNGFRDVLGTIYADIEIQQMMK
jgi:calcium-dependent protein kinase